MSLRAFFRSLLGFDEVSMPDEVIFVSALPGIILSEPARPEYRCKIVTHQDISELVIPIVTDWYDYHVDTR